MKNVIIMYIKTYPSEIYDLDLAQINYVFDDFLKPRLTGIGYINFIFNFIF